MLCIYTYPTRLKICPKYSAETYKFDTLHKNVFFSAIHDA